MISENMQNGFCRRVAIALVFMATGGCAHMASTDPAALPAGLAEVVSPARAPVADHGVSVESLPPSTEQQSEPVIVRGNDRMFRPQPTGNYIEVEGGDVLLRFEQAPVTDVVHAILGDILGLPYVVNQPVSGSLTIHTNAPLPRSQALSVLESVLQANGLSMALDEAGVYHVGRPESLRGLARSFNNIRSLPPGQSMVVVPLQYVGAGEMADILRPLAPAEAFVRVDTVRNLLVLSGSRANIDGWLEIVSTFDIDILQGMSLGLFPLKYTSVKEVEAGLSALVSGAGVASASTPADLRGQAADPGRGTGLALPGPLAGVIRLVAIERLNAILVVTPRSHYLDTVKEWIERFDQPRSSGDEPQLYVYPVQNGNAAHLASLLSAIFGDATSAAGGITTPQGALAPGLAAVGVGDSRSLSQSISQSSADTVSRSTTSSESAGLLQRRLSNEVKVVADGRNNALLIYAPASEYEKIAQALRRLDISPTQVLIEASIVEVTLTDELRYGLQWYFNGSLGSDYEGRGQLTSGQSSAIGAANPGFSYSVINPADQIRAVLTALAQKSLINVISSPSVLVQDNHTAQIQVGDQQPIRSSTTITDGVAQESIQYKDTGVELSVTPSVNAGGMVSMDVKQTVTDVGQVDVATGQRSFLQRQFSSRVAVRSGESVVLGGLIRDNASRGRQGLPLLQDVPFIGTLFSSTTESGTRTELVVMITPRVLRNDEDLRALSDEIRARLSGSLRGLPSWSSMGGSID